MKKKAISMKRIISSIVVIILIIAIGGAVYYYYDRETGKVIVRQADKIQQALQMGNQRFVSGEPRQHDYEKQILNTKIKQRPEAVVLSCMDSRSIPEVAFDQGIGKIFTIRVAGNVINQDILGSMEYGTKVVGAKLIVVLGHTNCGAVVAACKGIELGNLSDVIQQIQPAVQTIEEKAQINNCNNASLVDAIAKQNVINMVKQIPQQSQIIAQLVKAGKVKIVGAMYDVATGKVTFLNEKE